ncbi:hypothetical protein ACQ4XT_14045 [Halobacillus faecis]
MTYWLVRSVFKDQMFCVLLQKSDLINVSFLAVFVNNFFMIYFVKPFAVSPLLKRQIIIYHAIRNGAIGYYKKDGHRDRNAAIGSIDSDTGLITPSKMEIFIYGVKKL